MHIIPVLDIKDGRVVRARRGDRDNYRPIETPLSPTANIRDIAAGLLSIYPFPIVYIADLDAIERRRSPFHHMNQLNEAFPHSDIWLDAGFAKIDEVDQALATKRIFPVLGSESQSDASILAQLRSRLVLSLDYRDGFIGPVSILEDSKRWPSRIIVMTLGRVGANSGPDFDRLREIKQRARNRGVYAAGGVRDAGDLAQLVSMGIEGALVATSIHNGKLTPKVIASYMKSDQA